MAAESLDAKFFRAGRLMREGKLTAALDELLGVLRRDKRFRGGEVQKVVLALFDVFGDADPLTREYRGKLALTLF
jgi:thioredoxin-like negative regulator of GroEL